MRRSPISSLLGIATLLMATAGVSVVTAQENQDAHGHELKLYGIPESMRQEHAEIHAALERATREPGRVGAAARELVKVLHPHFTREEQIALPPLGLLASLSRGELTADMQTVLPLTDSLRAEMPRMLQEHTAIREATNRLQETARVAGNVAVVRLTESLALHAQAEEEVTYPAAMLVGDLVRLRGTRAHGACAHSGTCPQGGTCPHAGACPHHEK
jgi:hypothetical protein